MATKNKLKQGMLFVWEAKSKRGEKIRGEITANTLALARADLKKQGVVPLKLRKKSKPLFSKRQKRITQGDITIFSRQMATMISAGIPLVQAFDIVGKGLNHSSLQVLINAIKIDVESGTTFADSLRKHPKYFNDLFCNLVGAGEQSGSLDIMLDKVAVYKEKTESLKGKIKKALFYPAAVTLVAIVVTAILLIFVVPQFESLFKSFGADLPALTRLVVDLSEFVQAYWWMILGTIVAIIWGIIKARSKSYKVAYTLDKISLMLPVIGPILEKAAIARYARTLAITFAAGLPLADALKSVSGATGNLLFQEACLRIREDVISGQQMQLAMRSTNRFSNMIVQMVAIGEESGELESMLSKAADFYEEEVDNAVDGLSSLLEPIIMAVLGVLVGGLVIAMYLPIFKIGSAI